MLVQDRRPELFFFLELFDTIANLTFGKLLLLLRGLSLAKFVLN